MAFLLPKSPQPIDAIKTALRETTPVERDAFRHVYDVLTYRQSMLLNRRVTIGLCLTALLIAAAAVIHPSVSPLYGLLVVVVNLGGLGIGVWAAAQIDLRRARILAALLVLGALANVSIAMQISDAALLVLAAAAQLLWAFFFYRRQSGLSAQPIHVLLPDDLAFSNAVWLALRETDARRDPDLIVLSLGFSGLWRGWLLNDFAVFASPKAGLVAALQSEIIIQPQTKKWGRRWSLRVAVHLGALRSFGSIRPKDFDRYTEWKKRYNPGFLPETLMLTGVSEAPTVLRAIRVVVKILLAMGFLILFGYILFIVYILLHYR